VSDGYESLVRAANRARPDLRLSEDRHVRLEDVVAGRVKGRLSPADRIMAVPTGVASVDMTLAWEIFRCARKAGLGKHVRLT
jgi:ornithine cyclodeaminase/alanine dehydrogenase-like protein (mu-crystallin family)